MPTQTTDKASSQTSGKAAEHLHGQAASGPDVTICIVTHNSRADLEVCLTKLHEAIPTDVSIQVTVVDNTGTDGSSEYVRTTWPHVHLITNPAPRGFGANVNQAVINSSARYILVMNPDVILMPGAIETLVAYMDAHPEVGACGPKTFYPDGRLQPTCRQFPSWVTVLWRWLKLERVWQPGFYRRFLMLDWDHQEAQPVDWVMASCVLVRTAAFQEIQGFDTDFFLYYEDIDLCRRLWQMGYSVHYVPDATAIHAYKRQSARHIVNPLTFIHLSSILQYRRKHGMAVGQLRSRYLEARVLLLLIVGDLALTELALQLGRYARLWFPILGAYPYPAPSPLKPIIYWIVPVIWALVFSLLGLFSVAHIRRIKQELGRLLLGVMLSGLVFAGSLYALFLYEVYVPRLLLAYFLLLDWLLLAGERLLFRTVLSRNGLFYQPRALLVGSEQIGRRLVTLVSQDMHLAINMIGVVPWPPVKDSPEDQVNHILDLVRRLQIDMVVMTPPFPSREVSSLLLTELTARGVEIRLVPDHVDYSAYRVEPESWHDIVLLKVVLPRAPGLWQTLRQILGWR
ncbi:MAG: hypothetical protein KatS3mg050_3813 [Litorilinea sp.]|nr:MAG: hypothetical protein KatS3mg050_3813 [Litorilinea sp.]